MKEPVKVLTIAGSDSGGAAGLQADLKTFTILGAYGMSVITAVTAQNSVQVVDVQSIPTPFVVAQFEAVLTDYGAEAVKTGFIGRADLIMTIADKIRAYQQTKVVVDPVLVNHKGGAMFATEVVEAYRHHLLPLATIVTPNRAEAALLLGYDRLPAPETAVYQLHALGAKNILLKNGRVGDEMVDIFFDGTTLTTYRSPYLETINTHGSGDTLSAAICVFLAQGIPLATAVSQAHQLTAVAIQKAIHWQLGAGHGPVSPWFL